MFTSSVVVNSVSRKRLVMYHNEEASAFISRISSLPRGLVSLDAALRTSLKDEAALRELFATDKTRASTSTSIASAGLPQAGGCDPATPGLSRRWRVRQHVEHHQAVAEFLVHRASADAPHAEAPGLVRALDAPLGDGLPVQGTTLADELLAFADTLESKATTARELAASEETTPVGDGEPGSRAAGRGPDHDPQRRAASRLVAISIVMRKRRMRARAMRSGERRASSTVAEEHRIAKGQLKLASSEIDRHPFPDCRLRQNLFTLDWT